MNLDLLHSAARFCPDECGCGAGTGGDAEIGSIWDDVVGYVESWGKGSATGAAIGGAVGSIIPGLGTVIGAGIGGAAGGAIGVGVEINANSGGDSSGSSSTAPAAPVTIDTSKLNLASANAAHYDPASNSVTFLFGSVFGVGGSRVVLAPWEVPDDVMARWFGVGAPRQHKGPYAGFWPSEVIGATNIQFDASTDMVAFQETATLSGVKVTGPFGQLPRSALAGNVLAAFGLPLSAPIIASVSNLVAVARARGQLSTSVNVRTLSNAQRGALLPKVAAPLSSGEKFGLGLLTVGAVGLLARVGWKALM